MEVNIPHLAGEPKQDQPSGDHTKLNLRNSPKSGSSPFELIAAFIIAFILFLDGPGFFNLPGIFILAVGGLAKLLEIEIDVLGQHSMKRKREEDEVVESEIQIPKKKREVVARVSATDTSSDEIRAIIPKSEVKQDDNDELSIAKIKSHGLPEIEEGEPGPKIDSESQDHEHDEDGSCCSDDSDEDDDEESPFQAVLSAISLEHLPKLASKLRQQQDMENAQSGKESAESIDCFVNEKRHSGSFNLLFEIEFNDGVKWGLRVPEIGTADKFDTLAARAMENEILTMQFLKRKTTIPIPTIYGYNVSVENELNCPYILMEFVEGTLLPEKWFDKSVSKIELEQIRTRALKEMANAMQQLGQFRYDEGGALLFDDAGNPTGVGSMRVVNDLNEMSMNYGEVHELGPFSNPVAAITKKLDVHTQSPDDYTNGFRSLLRLLLTWIPQGTDPKFVLHHPDFDIQNIIVGDDGGLLAIVDWEGVSTQPRSIGNESYPLFLTRDLDPEGFLAGGKDSGDDEDDDFNENTPEELVRYRALYLEFIKNSKIPGEYAADSYDNWITENSILACSLATAIIPEYTEEILARVFKKLREMTAEDPRYPISRFQENITAIGQTREQSVLDHHLMIEIGKAIHKGELSEDRMGWLRDGFAKLWYTESNQPEKDF